MKILIVPVFGFFLASAGNANELAISVVESGFPGPAEFHFSGIDGRLATKSIEACGSTEAVIGISELNIKISGGPTSNRIVAILSKDGVTLNPNSLYFIYPLKTLSAMVTCRD